MREIKIHCYCKDAYFPTFPENSYYSDNVENVLGAIRDVLTNKRSGISKILIEDNQFDVESDIVQNQSLLKLENK